MNLLCSQTHFCFSCADRCHLVRDLMCLLKNDANLPSWLISWTSNKDVTRTSKQNYQKCVNSMKRFGMQAKDRLRRTLCHFAGQAANISIRCHQQTIFVHNADSLDCTFEKLAGFGQSNKKDPLVYKLVQRNLMLKSSERRLKTPSSTVCCTNDRKRSRRFEVVCIQRSARRKGPSKFVPARTPALVALATKLFAVRSSPIL